MRVIYLMVSLIFLFLSCTSSRVSSSTKKENIQQLVEDRNFEIQFDRAFPKSSQAFSRAFDNLNLSSYGNSSSVNLTGHYAYVRVSGDTISGNLPFFGERYMGAGYNKDESIRFDDVPKEYKKEVKSDYTQIRFRINQLKSSIENIDAMMRIYPNGKVDLRIISSQRSAISYLGKIDAIKEKE